MRTRAKILLKENKILIGKLQLQAIYYNLGMSNHQRFRFSLHFLVEHTSNTFVKHNYTMKMNKHATIFLPKKKYKPTLLVQWKQTSCLRFVNCRTCRKKQPRTTSQGLKLDNKPQEKNWYIKYLPERFEKSSLIMFTTLKAINTMIYCFE